MAAFFIFNVFASNKKLFMGDIGSLMLGFMLSIFAIKFIELNRLSTGIYSIGSSPAIAIAVLIIPIFDTIRVFAIRISKGKSPFVADKQHVHHYLLELTGSHKYSTFILLFVNILFILLGIVLRDIRVTYLVVILFLVAGILSGIPYQLVKNKRRKITRCKAKNKKQEFSAG